jgi:ATP-dependent Lon protease
LQEIPENVKNGLEIVPVRCIDKVLEFALTRLPEALPDEEPVAPSVAAEPEKAPVIAVKH